jgi:hypothetical protein
MHHDETVSTLKFGQLCKTIKNSARKNEVVDEKTLIRQYRSKISELTAQLAEAAGDPEVQARRRSSGLSRLESSNIVAEKSGELERQREINSALEQRLVKMQVSKSAQTGSRTRPSAGEVPPPF